MKEEKPLDTLNAPAIRRYLGSEWQFAGVEAVSAVDSTNLRLKEWARAGRIRPPFLLAADEQTAGRGRLGRRFISPLGGLYMSLLIPWESGAEPGRATLLSAVAVCRALEEMTPLRPRIKWVNDIFVDGKKVCGILTETAGESAVIGIGVNLLSPTGGFPPEAGAAGALDFPVDKNRLAARVTALILEGMKKPRSPGVLADYRDRMFLTGKTVRYIRHGVEKTALVTGVSDDGGLMVTGDGGDEILRSGEVTLGSQPFSGLE